MMVGSRNNFTYAPAHDSRGYDTELLRNQVRKRYISRKEGQKQSHVTYLRYGHA